MIRLKMLLLLVLINCGVFWSKHSLLQHRSVNELQLKEQRHDKVINVLIEYSIDREKQGQDLNKVVE